MHRERTIGTRRIDGRTRGLMASRFAPRPIDGVASGLILFDGICVFCSRWVAFVIARDPEAQFRFLTIQSDSGRELAARLGIDVEEPETSAVVLDGVGYMKSDAALMVLERLPRWRWVGVAWLCPRPIRDFVYDRIAKNRYRIFGKLDTCMVPTPDVRLRFVDRL
jgi:predicted DCC family thiol-disulfide oxidoreductase YuxK